MLPKSAWQLIREKLDEYGIEHTAGVGACEANPAMCVNIPRAQLQGANPEDVLAFVKQRLEEMRHYPRATRITDHHITIWLFVDITKHINYLEAKIAQAAESLR